MNFVIIFSIAWGQYFKMLNPGQNDPDRIRSQNWVFQNQDVVLILQQQDMDSSNPVLPRIQIKPSFGCFKALKCR